MTADHNHLWRWVFSQAPESGSAVVRDFSTGSGYSELRHSLTAGWTLVHCLMNVGQLAQAKKDPRMIVLPSLHDHDTEVHKDIVAAHKHLGAKDGMTTAQFLMKLAEFDPRFEPQH
jgi:hypothetical protein